MHVAKSMGRQTFYGAGNFSHQRVENYVSEEHVLSSHKIGRKSSRYGHVRIVGAVVARAAEASRDRSQAIARDTSAAFASQSSELLK